MAAKKPIHIISLSLSQFLKLTEGIDFKIVSDEYGLLRYAEVEIEDVKVSLLNNVDDGLYFATVPRCMKSNKAIAKIKAAED